MPAEPRAPGLHRLRPVRLLLGASAGLAVGGYWAARTHALEQVPPAVSMGWVAAGILAVGATVVLQVARTRCLLPGSTAVVTRAVVTAHGINTWLGALGDVVELWWLSRALPLGMGPVIGRLLYRAGATALGAVALVACAEGWVGLAVAAALLGVVAGAGAMGLPRVPGLAAPLLAPLPSRVVVVHLLLLTAQLAAGVAGVAAMVRATGLPLAWTDVVRASGVVDLLSYLPVPLSNVGFHHLGASLASAPGTEAWPAILHHGATLAVGSACVGWSVLASLSADS